LRYNIAMSIKVETEFTRKFINDFGAYTQAQAGGSVKTQSDDDLKDNIASESTRAETDINTLLDNIRAKMAAGELF
jgi:hypothetical protein